jgi:peptide alpha-N-acetyltransferase
MIEGRCEEVALEAEVTNEGALRLYQGLGFIRDKRLHRSVQGAPFLFLLQQPS